ncbi:hypothetical protein CAPTEDRAFT_202187 [Capitella teleta]|uniref:LRRNT domain-containing protein n=1 Tax=Capitella teleta TaxID=283909 RepID=R7TD46_CAPTE|nr:hypothetical protein CAPTEDRAFT_202187 [Capitella teleta]|eukprot:ELT91649.1 hypothetical protein CAPTEDRAFT_202187 [Capitella teleta]
MEIRRLLWLLVCLANFEERLCGNVNLSGKSLTSLPDDIVQNVTHLYLNDENDITSIESGCFKGTNLNWLRLSSNELTSIPDLHEVSTTLTILNVDSNEIATIAVEELSYLIKLISIQQPPHNIAGHRPVHAIIE